MSGGATCPQSRWRTRHPLLKTWQVKNNNREGIRKEITFLIELLPERVKAVCPAACAITHCVCLCPWPFHQSAGNPSPSITATGDDYKHSLCVKHCCRQLPTTCKCWLTATYNTNLGHYRCPVGKGPRWGKRSSVLKNEKAQINNQGDVVEGNHFPCQTLTFKRQRNKKIYKIRCKFIKMCPVYDKKRCCEEGVVKTSKSWEEN